ncbi:MAG: alpha amylase C-terminal domain-containing protein [Ardenticatenaceae bacterium]|nr:alpha amylase C-terminal domain-containing protein [Ardenticatenaceae bacterium]
MGAIPHAGGVTFRVWAPFADEVRVVGTFNEWDETAVSLQQEEAGYWAVNVPQAKPGHEYKYLIVSGDDEYSRLDPYARQVTNSVGNSVVHDPEFDWGESENFQIAPWNELVIYEMHVGTFNDDPGGEPGTFYTARQKLPYLQQLGVNAVQVMPPMEFPGGFSWGYNPALPFAIETDYGGPRAFKAFVKAAHELGMAVILDVVYNHLGPGDLDLWQFDGWQENEGGGIYFYNDHRADTPWGHTRPDYGRPEVRQYLRDNALMWLAEYHVDGLRWDATAYIRNVEGNDLNPANELPEGWSLMQWINEEIQANFPGKISIAEDLRGNEWLVKDTGAGGAGFGSQWDSNFVHPIRAAIISGDDQFRDLDAVSNALSAHYDGDPFKRVIYTESHDEVANGKARVPEEIWPDNSLSWFAKKRSTLGAACVFTAPGIPMIFQGQEFLEDKWFNDQDPLDWDRAKELGGFVQLYSDLIRLRLNRDGFTKGLTGSAIDIFHVDHENKLLAYHRWAEGGPGDSVVVVLNFANSSLQDYALNFPAEGEWQLRFDSHFAGYDESYEGQVSGSVTAEGDIPQASIAIAPYSALIYSQ